MLTYPQHKLDLSINYYPYENIVLKSHGTNSCIDYVISDSLTADTFTQFQFEQSLKISDHFLLLFLFKLTAFNDLVIKIKFRKLLLRDWEFL